MAALSNIRPICGELLSNLAACIRSNRIGCKSISSCAPLNKYSKFKVILSSSYCSSNVDTGATCMAPSSTSTTTSVRCLHTTTPKYARFQRPLPPSPDEADWSKMESLNSLYKHSFNPSSVERLLDQVDSDFPMSDMPDPFEKNYRRCFLCKNDVYLNHKNVRLLSQFVSPYTGRIYGRAITGLCIPMQKRVAALIKRARISGYMPYMFKDPKYLHDPQPYDIMDRKS